MRQAKKGSSEAWEQGRENLLEQVKHSTLNELPRSQQGNKINIREVLNHCFRVK